MIYGERIINEGKIKDAILGDNISREMAKWNAESKKLVEKYKWNDSDIIKAKQLIEQYDSDNKKWKSGNYYKLYSSNIDNYYERLKAKIPEDKKYKYNLVETYGIKLSPTNPNRQLDTTDDKFVDQLIKDIKYIESQLYKNSKWISKVETDVQKAIDSEQLTKDELKPTLSGHPLVPKLTAVYDGDTYIDIYDDHHNQDVRLVTGIHYDIADILNSGSDYEIRFGTGDGDEGCIYFE